MKKIIVTALLLLLTGIQPCLAAEAILPVRVRIISYEDYKKMQRDASQNANDPADMVFTESTTDSGDDTTIVFTETTSRKLSSFMTDKEIHEKYGVYYDRDGNPLEY